MNVESVMPKVEKRTQAERKEQMILRLKKTVICCLVEVGYNKTTTQLIAKTAEVSQGAIFRHFSNREALIVATANSLSEWMIDDYRQNIAKANLADFDVDTSLKTLKKIIGSDFHIAWIELMYAVRTDDSLMKQLKPIFKENLKGNQRLAKEFFPENISSQETFPHVIDSIVMLARGQMLDIFLFNQKEKAERLAFETAAAQLVLAMIKNVLL